MMAVFQAAPEAVSATLDRATALATGPWPETGAAPVRMGIHAGRGRPAGRRLLRTSGQSDRQDHGRWAWWTGAPVQRSRRRVPATDCRRGDASRPWRAPAEGPGRPTRLPAPSIRTWRAVPAAGDARRPPNNLPAHRPSSSGASRAGRNPALLATPGPAADADRTRRHGQDALALRAAEDLHRQFYRWRRFVDLSGSPTYGASLAPSRGRSGSGGRRPTARSMTVGATPRRQILLVLDNFEQVSRPRRRRRAARGRPGLSRS